MNKNKILGAWLVDISYKVLCNSTMNLLLCLHCHHYCTHPTQQRSVGKWPTRGHLLPSDHKKGSPTVASSSSKRWRIWFVQKKTWPCVCVSIVITTLSWRAFLIGLTREAWVASRHMKHYRTMTGHLAEIGGEYTADSTHWKQLCMKINIYPKLDDI